MSADQPTNEMIIIIRPSFKKVCGPDACRAALYNHILFRLAGKAKTEPDEKVKKGEVFWYASAEDICKDIDEAWCVNKVRKEIKAMVDDGLLGQRHNPAKGWDRKFQYFIGAKQGKRLLEKCKTEEVCLLHIGLNAEVLHLLHMVNAFTKNGVCICHKEEVDLPNKEDASTKYGGAIPKGSTKGTDKESTEEEESTYSEQIETAAPGAVAPTHAQSSQDVSYRPDFTANESRIANSTPQGDADYGQRTDARRANPAPLHHLPARGATDPVGPDLPQVIAPEVAASQETPVGAGDGTLKPAQASEQAQFSTQRNGFPQSAKVETKPKGARGKKDEPPPEFTDEGRKVFDAWCANFRSTPRAAKGTIDCANALYGRLVPWCRDLHMPCKDLLKEIKDFLFATDTNGFYKRGVTLCDVERDFEKWQSAKEHELEQANKAKSARSAPSNALLENLRAQQQACAQPERIAQ